MEDLGWLGEAGTSYSPRVALKSGFVIPAVGFGSAGLGAASFIAVKQAIEEGVELIDTAEAREWYRQDLVGQGLQAATPRGKPPFLSSKVHPSRLSWAGVESFFHQAEAELGRNPDIALLHFPRCWSALCGSNASEGDWTEAWKALEEKKRSGRVRSIGVSNFNEFELDRLVSIASEPIDLLQARCDPFNQAKQLRRKAREHGIAFWAYSLLGTQYGESNPVLQNPALNGMGRRHNASVATIVLRWALSRGMAALFRSRNVEHVREVIDGVPATRVNEEDLASIDSLDLRG